MPKHIYPTKAEIDKKIALFKTTNTKYGLLEQLIIFIIKNTDHSENHNIQHRIDSTLKALWGKRNKVPRGNSMCDYDSFYIYEMAKDMMDNATKSDVAAWDAALALLGNNCDSKKVESKKNRLLAKFPVGFLVDYDHIETGNALKEIQKQSNLHLFIMGSLNEKCLKPDIILIKKWIKSWNKKVLKNKLLPKKAIIQIVTK